MNQILFRLDIFEGPLDLLLKLISKHKLNIYDIEISELLKQYLNYIESDEQDFDLETAGEFLEMAAKLIYIKTASLLPKPEADEAVRLKKELEGTLIEYSVCKTASETLSKMYKGDDIFVRKPIKIESKLKCQINQIYIPDKLAMTYLNISRSAKINQENEKKIIENRINSAVKKKVASVISKVIFVLKKLYKNNRIYMNSLYDGINDRSERVATFLAVLELTKNGRIKISDDNTEVYFTGRKKKGI